MCAKLFLSGGAGGWVLNDITIIIIMTVIEQSTVFKQYSKSLCILSHLNAATTLKSRCCYCPQFINAETEAREIERLAHGYPACEWWNQNSNLITLNTEVLLIITAFQYLSCRITPHLKQFFF